MLVTVERYLWNLEHSVAAGVDVWNGGVFDFDLGFGVASEEENCEYPPVTRGLLQILKAQVVNMGNANNCRISEEFS